MFSDGKRLTCRSAGTLRKHRLWLPVIIILPVLLLTTVLFKLNRRTLQRHEENWVPCAVINCELATTVAAAPMVSLRNKRRDSLVTAVEDFKAWNLTRSLQNVYFDIPKVIHQVWLGDDTPPTVWIDTWRCALLLRYAVMTQS